MLSLKQSKSMTQEEIMGIGWDYMIEEEFSFLILFQNSLVKGPVIGDGYHPSIHSTGF